MKYLVLGSGLMGRAVAYDLAKNDNTTEIRLADINITSLKDVKEWINSSLIKIIELDARDHFKVLEAMKGVNVVINCMTYHYSYDMVKLAIQSGVNYCDLGSSEEIINKVFALDNEAKNVGVTIMPSCGLAPGVVSIIATAGFEKCDKVEEIHLRVGGLPQNPKPPLDYSIVFSVKGLMHEYLKAVEVVRNGKLMKLGSLSEIEELCFPEPFGKVEAFNTAGGAATLPKTLAGKVNVVDYKTIRYKGHCEKIKTIFDLGFKSEEEVKIGNCMVSPIEVLEKMLEKSLTYEDPKDVTLVLVEVIGYEENRKKKITYQIMDYYDEQKNITSMMRMTAFPTSIIAQMIANEIITKKGVLTQEFNVPASKMLENMRKRNIKVEEKIEFFD
ncbi:MAG: saccharopine dehydrogenase family protein [Candidatus Thorarchaeota archaeon]